MGHSGTLSLVNEDPFVSNCAFGPALNSPVLIVLGPGGLVVKKARQVSRGISSSLTIQHWGAWIVSEESIEARLAQVEKELRELKDREAIREVVHRYCQAVDRCDLELLISCYHPDSYDDHGFFAGNGHDFARFVIPVLQQIDSSVHSITNSRIELSGDRAYCASQWSVVHRLKRKGKYTDFLHDGRYLDIFEKRDGEWKILHRALSQSCNDPQKAD